MDCIEILTELRIKEGNLSTRDRTNCPQSVLCSDVPKLLTTMTNILCNYGQRLHNYSLILKVMIAIYSYIDARL